MDKISVRRANVVLDIKPEDKEYYMKNGFSVIDDNGKVVEEALSNDPNALKIQVADLTSKLAEAYKEIAKLKEELDAKGSEAVTSEPEVVKKERKPRNSSKE